MAKFFEGLMGAMGLAEQEEFEEDYIEEEEEEQTYEPVELRSSHFKKNNSKIVDISTKVQMKVVVTTPEAYDEAQDICDFIKSRQTVVVNLEKLDRGTAQRIMDFLCGSCYSLEGELQRVADSIFIVAPKNVDLSGDFKEEFKEELKTKGIILPWMNGLK